MQTHSTLPVRSEACRGGLSTRQEDFKRLNRLSIEPLKVEVNGKKSVLQAIATQNIPDDEESLQFNYWFLVFQYNAQLGYVHWRSTWGNCSSGCSNNAPGLNPYDHAHSERLNLRGRLHCIK
jgi:hypothetical protein